MFYAITRLVLQTKKDTAKEGGRQDTFKVGGGGASSKKQKGKCC